MLSAAGCSVITLLIAAALHLHIVNIDDRRPTVGFKTSSGQDTSGQKVQGVKMNGRQDYFS